MEVREGNQNDQVMDLMTAIMGYEPFDSALMENTWLPAIDSEIFGKY